MINLGLSINKLSRNYNLLKRYLLGRDDDIVLLSFAEIEEILGAPLPNSASKYVTWWCAAGHSHAQIWEQSGYKAINITVNMQKGQMQFRERSILS